MIYKKIENLRIWEHNLANKNKKNYVCSYMFFYTIIFGLLCMMAFYTFYRQVKGFVWIGETKDGLVQHYNSLLYYGQYLRDIVKGVVRNGS